MADTRKDCCKIPSNLSVAEPYEGRKDLTFRRCWVCRCRHFQAIALGLGKQTKP